MKYLLLALKVILNIFFFVLYWALTCLVIGMGYAFTMKQDIDSSLANKIGIFSLLFVLLITLILRKFFYISCKDSQKGIKAYSYIEQKKEKKSVSKKHAEEGNEEDEIKIYVDKEIK